MYNDSTYIVSSEESKEDVLKNLKHIVYDEDFDKISLYGIKILEHVKHSTYLYCDAGYYKYFNTKLDHRLSSNEPVPVYNIKLEEKTDEFPTSNQYWNKITMEVVKRMERIRKIRMVINQN